MLFSKNKKIIQTNKNRLFLLSIFVISILSAFFLFSGQAVGTAPPPVGDFWFKANGTINAEIEKPGPVTLSWSVPENASCYILELPPDVVLAMPTGSTTVQVTTHIMFTMNCFIVCTWISREVTVVINPPIPTLGLSVTPAFVDFEDAHEDIVTLTWSSISTISCSGPCPAMGVYGSCDLLSGPGSLFTITCQGYFHNSVRGTVAVASKPGNAPHVYYFPGDVLPTATLSVYPSVIAPFGQNVTLSWTSSNADMCWLDGISVPLYGTTTVWVGRTHQKFLECRSHDPAGGEAWADAIVTLTSIAPQGTFTATPQFIDPPPPDTGVTLTWDVSFATWCGFLRPAKGSRIVFPTRTMPYHKICTGPGGTFIKTRIVIVQHQYKRDTAPPTAEIFLVSYRGWRWPPADWWRKSFYVLSRATDNRGLACVQFRTAWLPEARPAGAYVYTSWRNIAQCRERAMASLNISWRLRAIGWRLRFLEGLPAPLDPERQQEKQRLLAEEQQLLGTLAEGSFPVKEALTCEFAVNMSVGGWGARCPTQGEGACKIEIRAVDRAGNVDEDWEPFNIDWSPPRIEIEEILPPEEPTP